MKVTIQNVTTINEIKTYWTDEDYVNLLKAFDYQDTEQIKKENLREMLLMAITDFDPHEAARIILDYKLGDYLNEGQIQSISHEMTADKVAEEYPEPGLHYDLFNINQLLFKAFNGTFPNTEATQITFEILDDEGIDVIQDWEIIAKVIAGGLKDRCLVKRLYADQLDGTVEFKDAHKFIWSINHPEKNIYQLLTSNYWISQEDIKSAEYSLELPLFEEE